MAAAKSTPEVTEAQAPVDNPAADTVKVQVRSTPTVSDTSSDVSSKADLTVHHELTITPSPEAAEKPEEVESPTADREPVKLVTSEPAMVAEVELPKTAVATPLESPKPPVDDAPKTDPKPSSSQVEGKNDEMQSPKVFDTKQYHLPIDEGAAGGKGKSIVIFLVVLVFLAVGAAVAIDAEWVDVGFDLPFDLIK